MFIKIQTLGLAAKIYRVIKDNDCMIESYQAREIVKMLKKENHDPR